MPEWQEKDSVFGPRSIPALLGMEQTTIVSKAEILSLMSEIAQSGKTFHEFMEEEISSTLSLLEDIPPCLPKTKIRANRP